MKALFPIPQRSKHAVAESRQRGVAFNRVLAIVTGEPSDEGVLAHAADLVRPVKGRLLVLYVIQVDRSLPVDAEIGPAAAKGEDILRRTEEVVRLPKDEFEAHMVQARELGSTVVAEAIAREVDAVVVGTVLSRGYDAYSTTGDIPFILKHAPCLVVLRREAPANGAATGSAAPRRPGTNGIG